MSDLPLVYESIVPEGGGWTDNAVGGFRNYRPNAILIKVYDIPAPPKPEPESCGHPGCSICTPEGRAEYELVKAYLKEWDRENG